MGFGKNLMDLLLLGGDEPGEVCRPAVAIDDRLSFCLGGPVGFRRDADSRVLIGFDEETREVGVVGSVGTAIIGSTSAGTGSSMKQGRSRSETR